MCSFSSLHTIEGWKEKIIREEKVWAITPPCTSMQLVYMSSECYGVAPRRADLGITKGTCQHALVLGSQTRTEFKDEGRRKVLSFWIHAHSVLAGAVLSTTKSNGNSRH